MLFNIVQRTIAHQVDCRSVVEWLFNFDKVAMTKSTYSVLLPLRIVVCTRSGIAFLVNAF